MVKQTITIRINYKDYLAIRKIVKPEPNESFATWIFKVRLWMERRI